ncbi:MAG: aspartate kinase [Anaerolineae bacterium]
MWVLKFGGTSVGDARCFEQVADIVLRAREAHGQVVVVVSAMSGVTDALLDAARAAARGDEGTWLTTLRSLQEKHTEVLSRLVAEGPLQRETSARLQGLLTQASGWFEEIQAAAKLAPQMLDLVGSLGERLSTPLLVALLRSRGCPAEAVEATEIIVTDDNFRSANPFMAETEARARERLLPLVREGTVPVVTGFLGATPDGRITTLGRGGSDYTAGILGACLDADEVQIWTDVDGILTADPRIVPDARPLRELSYTEAAELCYFGAKVLHPKTILPTVERGIPVRVLNTFNPAAPGTRIVREAQGDGHEVRAITTIKGLSLISVEGRGMLGVPGIAARTFAAAAREGVSVVMISQSSSEQSICFAIPARDAPTIVQALEKEFARELAHRNIDRIWSLDHVAIIAVVGPGVTRSPLIAARVFNALGSNGIQVNAITLGTSMAGISMVVRGEDAERATRYIHRALGLGAPAPQGGTP